MNYLGNTTFKLKKGKSIKCHRWVELYWNVEPKWFKKKELNKKVTQNVTTVMQDCVILNYLFNIW